MSAKPEPKYVEFRQTDGLFQFVIAPPAGWPPATAVGNMSEYIGTLVANLDRWVAWNALKNERDARGLCLYLHVAEAMGGAGMYTVQNCELKQATEVLSRLRLSPTDTLEAQQILSPTGAGQTVVLALIERTKFGEPAEPAEPALWSTICVI